MDSFPGAGITETNVWLSRKQAEDAQTAIAEAIGPNPSSTTCAARAPGTFVEAGVPERAAMMIGEWKTRSVFDRYNTVSERNPRDAAAKLGWRFAEIDKACDKATLRQLSRSGENGPPKLWS